MDLSALSELVRTAAGALVWAVANLVYFDVKRRGRTGWTRLVSFWLGMPATWLTFFILREGIQPPLEPPDDEETLLREIRRDRALRSGDDAPPEPQEPSPGSPSAT